jgi:hypothetical protein
VRCLCAALLLCVSLYLLSWSESSKNDFNFKSKSPLVEVKNLQNLIRGQKNRN